MKKRYYFITLVAVILVMTAGFSFPAEAQPTYDSIELYVKVNGTEGRINFRSGPGTDYPVMSELPNGQILPITEQVYSAEDGFYYGQTIINGITGYVSLRQTITVYETYYSEPAVQSPEPEGGSSVPISEMRAEDETALLAFLEKYTWLATDYDYTDVFGGGHYRNLLEGILCHPSCVDEAIYPGIAAYECWNGADPQGRWTSYRSFNEEKADWILRNVFNCTDETIQFLKEQTLLNQNIYLQDGSYYSFLGGVGDGYIVNSYEIQYNGTEYIVNYSITDYYPNIIYLSAVLQLKEIDGNRYWSLYFMREN